MSSLTNPKCIIPHLPRGETILLQINAEKSSTFIPKTIKWSEITIPETVEIIKDSPPPNLDKKEISDIIEGTDGRILLRFNSFRENQNKILPPRSSYSEPYYSTRTRITEQIRNNIVDFNSPLPRTLSDEGSTDNTSHPTSPTRSEIYSGINVITKDDFEINKEYLKRDFLSPINKEKVNWFMTIEKPIRDKIRELWYDEMKRLKTNIPHFTWLSLYLNSKGINNPFSRKSYRSPKQTN